ncbi:CarD family transcriptional regulator [Treponema lecithinolyticum]|jgi:transcriptional regulatory protein|uniref:CarD-like protein n=1 Tax=Treponema lecithinolyticum ATCC 700332 TaxID=1321815 RepID=A0ABN0P1F8_TRELE|nr:CarD family transcriptional regulator [Treponema lecithinolyticum]ERJ94238.1 CarD-like protein [Treponema lecithinolyticum ATCC 700332]
MSKKKTAFKVNQKIVYPSQGVGKIIEIKEKDFGGQKLLYYVMYLEVSDMTIMVPVDRCTELGIRSIVSAAEAEQALQTIGEDFEPVTSDWKLRYQMNLDLLKKGTVSDIAMIVRSLYRRSKVKELPILERKLYDSAKKLLEDEISFALDKPLKEVEALIHEKLEPPGAENEIKRNNSVFNGLNDDDEFLDDEDEDIVNDEEDDDDDGEEE